MLRIGLQSAQLVSAQGRCVGNHTHKHVSDAKGPVRSSGTTENVLAPDSVGESRAKIFGKKREVSVVTNGAGTQEPSIALAA